MTYIATLTPPLAWAAAIAQVTWTTGAEQTIWLSGGVPRTGYYFCCVVLTILSGSGDLQTIRLNRYGIQNLSTSGVTGSAQRATQLLAANPPIQMNAGDQFQVTGSAASSPANNDGSRSTVMWGFIPTQQWPK